ncbi:hypothetical protein D3C76_1557400 [compost metagenome]
MNRRETYFCTGFYEDFHDTVMENRCGQFAGNIVVNVSYRAVRFGNNEDMRCKCCSCIICEQNSLKRNFNFHIFRNIQEYSTVPESRMQSGKGMLICLHSCVQVRFY